MLAVSLLAFSDAYTYHTFFKVFTIVVIFGLFYGTFFLPVILSIFAPQPYNIMKTKQHEGKELSEIEKPEEAMFLKTHNNIDVNCDSKEADKLNDVK